MLSFEDQQRMSVARAILARPDFALLDQLNSALGGTEFHRILELLADAWHHLHFASGMMPRIPPAMTPVLN